MITGVAWSTYIVRAIITDPKTPQWHTRTRVQHERVQKQALDRRRQVFWTSDDGFCQKILSVGTNCFNNSTNNGTIELFPTHANTRLLGGGVFVYKQHALDSSEDIALVNEDSALVNEDRSARVVIIIR